MNSLHPVTRVILLLILLGTANTLPIVAHKLLGNRWEAPVDLGAKWFDKRPVFGPHKTWRGLAASVGGTTIPAWLAAAGPENGFLLATLSMAGDLAASFLKRRLNMESGQRAPGIDQGVEALLPLAIMRDQLAISWIEVATITFLFALSEITLSPLLFRLGLRRNPY